MTETSVASHRGEAPAEPITITAEQRDALYGQLLDHLSGIGDLRLVIHHGDFATADRLGREFTDELRLILDDLGWGDGDGRPVTLTTPTSQLRRVFTHIRQQAVLQQQAEENEQAALRQPWERAQLVAETCDQVLAAIAAACPPMKVESVSPQLPRH